jgi:hypothetical protein
MYGYLLLTSRCLARVIRVTPPVVGDHAAGHRWLCLVGGYTAGHRRHACAKGLGVPTPYLRLCAPVL